MVASKAAGTALVTGASTGIGAVYAERLARRGYDLILVARDKARLEALAERLRGEAGVEVDVLAADLTDRDDLGRVEQRLLQDEAVTLLINNAGMSINGTILDNDAPAIERLIALNITAPTLLVAAAAKAFKARDRGAIVNVASVLALAPELFEGVYSGSKAHLLNLTLSLARTFADSQVRVQAVLPGATRTEIWERSGKDVNSMPVDMVMEAGDLVDAALAGLDQGEVVTIPPLQDESMWTELNARRLAMAPHLSKREPALRYRPANAA